MKRVQLWFSAVSVAATLAFGAPQLIAQTKPANATGECKDGTYTTTKSKKGACASHGGVQTWYADSAKADAKAAGAATKQAGKDVGHAAKDVGKATKDGAKAVGNALKPRPSDAPKDATAKCKDGTYSMATQHKGACANHGGVADWYK
jgi:hypothetical protein